MPSLPDRSSTAAGAASDYFNSLPIDHRRKLAPLLEEYRLMGMREYAAAVHAATGEMRTRIARIAETTEAVATSREEH